MTILLTASLRFRLLAASICLWTVAGISSIASQPESPIQDKLYAGQSLAIWQQRLVEMDPASPASAAHVPGLIALAADPQAQWFTRRQAGLMLGRIGRPADAAIPVLIRLLGEPDAEEGSTAAWAAKSLALMGPDARDAAEPLIEIVQDTDRPQEHQAAALEALGRIGAAHHAVLPAIVELLRSPPDPDAVAMQRAAARKEMAVEAIALIGPDAAVAVPALARLAVDPRQPETMRRAAVTALGRIGAAAEAALATLAEVVVLDESAAVRDKAAESLAQVGRPAVGVLVQMLAVDDAEVRWRAAAALGIVGRDARDAVEPLSALFDNESGQVRSEACRSVWKITTDPRRVLPTIVDQFTSPDREVRMQALNLWQEIGPGARPAVPDVRKLLDDDRTYVRQAAAKALEQFPAP